MLNVYAVLWDTHVLPRLGSLRLREITPSIVTRFRLELEAEGVGRVSIHKAMTLLQACSSAPVSGIAWHRTRRQRSASRLRRGPARSSR